MNPNLRLAIDKARSVNMPNENVERAIKRGTGELKDEVEITESVYEGFGPIGIALLIHSVTDNKNRTVSNIRNLLNKHGGTMGGAGATAWMFEKRGVLQVEVSENNAEEIQLLAIECGAQDVEQDVEQENNLLSIYTNPKDLFLVKEQLEKKGIHVSSAEINYIPKNTVKVEDENSAKKILNLLEILEEDDDVVSVASNFDISEQIMHKIMSR